MIALTVQQPFASLIVIGKKQYETRCWPTDFRGRLIIHAGKGVTPIGAQAFNTNKKNLPFPLPKGMIIGAVDVVDCVQANKPTDLTDLEKKLGYFTQSYFAWKLANPVRFETPIEIPGKMGLWNLPPNITEKLCSII